MILGTFRIIYHFFVATLRYSTVAVIAILVILGGFSVYEFFIEDEVPRIRTLTHRDRELEMARSNTTRSLAFDFKEEECWDALQPTLQILDKVCPEVSKWVRDRHANGKIVWEKKMTMTYARYDYINKKLIFNRISFYENDGVKASILAHEFRHSRQSFTKFYRSVVACMICREPKPNIVENDAYLFENKIIVAIFLGEELICDRAFGKR